MTLERQMRFWVAALAVFILVVWVLADVLLPFVAGLVLAYFLDPVADRLERLGIGRVGATLLILLVFLITFVLVLVLLLPILGQQLAGLIARLPTYATALQGFVTRLSEGWLGQIVQEHLPELQQNLGNLTAQGASFVGRAAASLWSGGQAIISVFALFVITPVVAFYLLVDWDRMVDTLDSWVPRPHRPTVHSVVGEIDRAIAGFLRGQATVCLLLGAIYALGLSMVGLNSGALIGIAAGLISFVPYVGTLSGVLVGTIVAVVQFWPDWPPVAAVLGVFAFGQFLEGYVLSPRLIGTSVGLHPVWLMFSLVAFGSLFGFVGLLIAVPVAAAIGVLLRHALRQYLASPLYTGVPNALPPDSGRGDGR